MRRLQQEGSNPTDDRHDAAVDLPDRRLRTEESFIITFCDRCNPLRLSILRSRDDLTETVGQWPDEGKMAEVSHGAEIRTSCSFMLAEHEEGDQNRGKKRPVSF